MIVACLSLISKMRVTCLAGTGAVSSWPLKMLAMTTNKGIDLGKLTDVIICLRYTALSGGAGFEQIVRSSLKN